MAMFNKADKTAPGHYDPSQTALLLMDLHSIIVGMVEEEKGISTVQAAANMRNWAKSQGIQVIHALVDFDSSPFETCRGFEMFQNIGKTAKSSGGDKEPEVLVEGGGDETFLRKLGHVSALRSYGIHEFLEKKGIKSLLLMGLSTSGCVLRTAAAAPDYEYVTTVISDGCADREDAVHDMLIGKVLDNRGWVATSKEFQEGYVNRK